MNTNQINKIIIFGGGRMGTALGKGFASKGLPKNRIFFTQRNPAKKKALLSEGFNLLEEKQFGQACDLVIIAVKPKDMAAVLNTIPQIVPAKTPVVSVAAVVKLQEIRVALPDYPVFRIRPNILVEIAAGNLLLASESQKRSTKDYDKVKAIFSIIGTVFEFPESVFGQLTWESSSIPIVFLSRIMEKSLQSFPASEKEKVAELMLAGIENFCSYLRTAQRNNNSIFDTTIALQDKVITKNGLNDAAFQFLDNAGFWEVFNNAAQVYKDKELQGNSAKG